MAAQPPIASQIRKRAASWAVLFMVVAMLAAIFANLTLVGIYSRAGEIVQLASQQVRAWERIERSIMQAPLRFASGTRADLVAEQIRAHVTAQLAALEVTHNDLIAVLTASPSLAENLLGGVERDEYVALANVDSKLQENIIRFVNYPSEIMSLGLSTWDTELQILLKSGKYLDPPRELARLAQDHALESSNRVLLASVIINFLLIAAVLAIWRLFIVSGFNLLAEQHAVQLRIKERLIKRNAQFTAAFFSLNDPACVIRASGEIEASNTHFDERFLSADQGVRQLRDVVALIDDDSQRTEILALPSTEEIIIALSDAPIAYIGNVPFDFRCSKVESSEWFIVVSDQSLFYDQKSRDLHNERLKTLGEISGGVAHDFNNILATIMGRVELLGIIAEPNEVIRAEHEKILATCERGRSLTTQLLSFARKQTLKPEKMECNQLAAHLRDSVFVPANIELRLLCDADGVVNIDSRVLVTSVENIVRNSTESIGDKDGLILITLSRVRDSGHEGFLRVSIEDDGPGFSAIALKRALEPFYSTKFEQHGTGLGLAMVMGFVSQSGGIMSIENRSDGGARVLLDFPLVEAPLLTDFGYGGREFDQVGSGETRLPNGRCLVVEDNLEIQDTFSKFLQTFFDSVCVAADNREASAVIRQQKALSAAIFDWSLPDGDSQKTIAMLRQIHPDAAIVIVSGLVNDEMLSFAQDQKVVVLGKPVSFRSILTHLMPQDLICQTARANAGVDSSYE